jgi:hypothetical protein
VKQHETLADCFKEELSKGLTELSEVAPFERGQEIEEIEVVL